MPKPVRLRAPTAAERKSGLPTSKKDAISQGLTRFIHPDGEERIIRNFGSNAFPNGVVARASNRKETRGGGTDGSRSINEKFVTPPDADPKAYSQAMSDAASEGKEGHHVRPVARTADGARFSEARGGSNITQIQKSYDAVGTPLGNQQGNVDAESPQNHRQIHRQYDAMDQGIARAGTGPDQIFKAIQGAVRLNIDTLLSKFNGNGNGNGNGHGNGNGNAKKNGNGKSNGNVSPALNRGVIKSSSGSISFAFDPSTRSVNTGLHGPHIFLP